MSIKSFVMLTGLGAWSRLLPDKAAGWLIDKFLTPMPWRKPAPEPSGMRTDLPDGGVLWSDPGGGKNALLVHGWSGHRSQFGPIADRLRATGYAVHLLDPPGHGASHPQRSNPARFAKAIAEAAGHIGPLDLAVGHSMGGGALMHLACGEAPLLANRLVVISAPHGVKHPIEAIARQAGFGRQAARLFFQGVENEVGLSREAFDVLPRAAAARVALLIVHDREDPQIPFSHAEDLVRAWPNAQLAETRGCGHNRTLGSDRALEAVARFSRNPDSSAAA